MLTCAALIRFGIAGVLADPPVTIVILQIIGAVAGILLPIGLWTPVAGTLAAIVNVWIALAGYFPHADDPWITILQAVLGAVIAMVGPGALSIDGRLYGRKPVNFPERR
jgi:uncharacterized membrane protein YphA (DoxX/SURF4 family)